MSKPARVQVPKSELDEANAKRAIEEQQQQQPSTVFNTWYGKWAGGDKKNTRFRSAYRCDAELDSGVTKAKGPYFCLWFARGSCYKGSDCEALHRIPREEDALRINSTTDCFGRQKHAEFREDMAGVGSLLHENKTLFVGYFDRGRGANTRLAEQIRSQFAEWGNVKQVRLGKNGSIAFVSYSLELSAQFAKEAMSNQTITGHETLLVRWSRESAQVQKKTGPPKDPQEIRIRQIVQRVIKERKDAEQASATAAGIKRSTDTRPGLVSDEALRKLQQLKKRKEGTSAGETDLVKQEHGILIHEPPPPADAAVENADANVNTRKPGGLVDYD